MTRLRTLTRMALHEMWISFRLIAVVGLPMLGGILVIGLPPEFGGVTAIGGAAFWYAIVAGAAICVASGVAAGTMAHERRRGTVAWMAVRAVPRAAVLFSWFVAIGLLLTVGIAVGSIGAWLAALTHAESPPDVVPFAAALVATVGASLAAVALGLLIGAVLRPLPAVLVALVLTGAVLAAAILQPAGGLLLPTGGIGLLSHLDALVRPISGALESTGVALAVAALLLAAAGAVLERSDL
ncbi:MAG: hypothetical protein ABI578_05460 [Chloroflexota bacterium]